VFTRQFWIPTAERAVKTFAQALATLLIASNTGLLNAPWTASLSAAGMAAVVSVLTSVASLRVGPADSPSMVRNDPPAPTAQPGPAPTPSVAVVVEPAPVAVPAVAAA
jgi:Putative lactococcus lactis phage r1t holin